MAVTYWNPYTSSSTSTSIWNDPWGSSASTHTGGYYYYGIKVVVKQILIEMPETWDDNASEDFVRLVNLETNTGWKVTMVIKGDILVTDPNVETRTMDQFIPLLSERASQEDLEKILQFFIDYPIE